MSSNFIPQLFATIDRKDAKHFATFLTPDGTFKFGNWPAAKGTENVTAAVSEFFSSIEKVSHKVEETWSEKDALFVKGEVTYVRKDGKTVGPLPFMNLFKLNGEKVREYLVYADVSPLYA